MTRSRYGVVRVGAFGLLIALAAACAEDAESPLGVTADSVVISEDAVIVDSTVLTLVSDSATRAAGNYRFVGTASAPEIEAGDIIVGAEQGGYLRRVVSAGQAGDTLILNTEQAALTDAITTGTFSATIPVDPGSGTGAAAGMENVEYGPMRVVSSMEGAALSEDGINLTGTVLFDGEACSTSGGSCADLQLVIENGVIDFSHEVDVGAEIDIGAIQEAHASVSGALQLDAALAATVNAELNYEGEVALLTARTPFYATIPPSPFPVAGYIETKFFARFTVLSQGQIGLSTGFESLHTVEAGAVYDGEAWSPLFETDRSYSELPTSWDGSVELEAALTVRPEVGVYLYTVAGGFINVGPYGRFEGVVTRDQWSAELAAGLAAELGMRFRILSWNLAEFSHETSLVERVIFADSGTVQQACEPGWHRKAMFPGSPRRAAVGFSLKERGYVGTGRSTVDGSPILRGDVWEYDAAADSWTQLPGVGARSSAVGFSTGENGYVGTGKVSTWSYEVAKDFWEYDTDVGDWNRIADLPGHDRLGAVSFVIDSIAYVGAGKANNQTYLQDVYRYNPANDSWVRVASLPGARMGAVAFAVNGRGYVGLGEDANGVRYRDFWEYDPEQDRWSQIASFPASARSFGVAFSIGGKGYVGGGYDGSGRNDLWSYDPLTGSWSQETAIPIAVSSVPSFALADKGYLLVSSDLWEYCP